MGDTGCGESSRRGHRLCRGCDRKLVRRTIGRLSLNDYIRSVLALLRFLFPILGSNSLLVLLKGSEGQQDR